ncbi:host-nuclease inhibitor Gam family protein [Luteimonas sp. FXH3W]|uniref:Host-nuclease inhibitor Gam family protein n=1 Tax=Aquilutibacter rugosus TaxID=3115820 RepID=A0ABU7UVW6_9GAMM
MSKKTRIKASAIEAPKNRDEAAEMVGRIGAAQRERQRIQAQMNDDLNVIRAKYEYDGQTQQAIIDANFAAVQIYAEANKDDLLKGKLKTVKLSTGELSWRKRPASVSIRGVDGVLGALKSLKLDRFIRTKEEIDKSAILADRDAAVVVKGITINDDAEDFVVKPFETELEETR